MAVPETDGPKLTFIGKFFALVVIAGSLYGAYYLYSQGRTSPSPKVSTDPGGSPTSTAPPNTQRSVEVGLAYGTEKKRWLEEALVDFNHTPAGANIKVNLIPLGSLEGAQAILRGDDSAKKINAWAPASSLYKQSFVQDWKDKFGNNPILKEEQLALTPMVFVFWDERFQPFYRKYNKTTFKTIGQALAEKGGWDAISGTTSNWGFFKFGHTHPNKSNSGLMTLVLMAYDFRDKSRDLTLGDITAPDFQDWMNGIERAANCQTESTGTLMRDMVLKGPSTYDCLFVYESVVIDYLKNAEGRSGRLHVEYPKFNMWNDNPYYVLDTTWSTPEQRQAAQVFLDFLMSEPVQKQSLTHGFRPGNPSVPIKFPESPFVQYESYGLKVDLPVVCDPPKPEVVNNLLIGWQRSQGNR
jgi:ABC-type Fe3+ transport system substrate-binding protein